MSAATESVTLAKALSLKNRLAGRLAKAKSTFQESNCVPKGQRVEGSVDVRAIYARYLELQDALVVVKAAIQRANVPVFETILAVGELKDRLSVLNSLNTKHGSEAGYNGVVFDYDAVYRAPEVARMIAEIESEVDRLQDRLAEFNATTRVELPASALSLAR